MEYPEENQYGENPSLYDSLRNRRIFVVPLIGLVAAAAILIFLFFNSSGQKAISDSNSSNNSPTNFQVGEVPTSFVCDKDADLFVKASEDCSPYSTICNITRNFLGSAMFEKTVAYFEIQGPENGKCAFYFRYNNITLDYSQEYVNYLASSGINQSQIELGKQRIGEQYKSFIGKDSTCRYDSSNLSNSISELSQGNILMININEEGSDCTGSLHQS